MQGFFRLRLSRRPNLNTLNQDCRMLAEQPSQDNRGGVSPLQFQAGAVRVGIQIDPALEDFQ